MSKSPKNPKVDKILRAAKAWREEMETLREFVLECGLTEELKWFQPCYTSEGKNVVLIHGFKEYCALLFMKGALLKDKKGILIQQTENVQSGRQIRFTSLKQIVGMESALKAYVREAVKVEKAGLEVPMKKTAEFAVPEEFLKALDKSAKLKTAFQALTPGRQRGYLLFFAGAKQSATRAARVEKCAPQILKGKGLQDED